MGRRSRSRSPRSYSRGRGDRRRSPSPAPRGGRGASPRDRSRGYSPRDRDRGSRRGRSPSPRRGGGYRAREGPTPPPSRCLGIFGMHERTTERDIQDLFDRYPGFMNIRLIKDYVSNRSRGFGFMNFETSDDATYVRDKCNGMEIDGRSVFIQYSHSGRAVTPTPGVYCGARERDMGGRRAPRYKSRSRSPRRR